MLGETTDSADKLHLFGQYYWVLLLNIFVSVTSMLAGLVSRIINTQVE